MRAWLLGVWVTVGGAVRGSNLTIPPERPCSLRTTSQRTQEADQRRKSGKTYPEIINPLCPAALLLQMYDVPSGSSWSHLAEPRGSHYRYEPKETFDHWAITHKSIRRPLSTELTYHLSGSINQWRSCVWCETCSWRPIVVNPQCWC